QAEDGIRDFHVTGVQTCALPIWKQARTRRRAARGKLESRARPDAGESARGWEWGFRISALHARPRDRGIANRPLRSVTFDSRYRSEERRVGKEWSAWWWSERERT